MVTTVLFLIPVKRCMMSKHGRRASWDQTDAPPRATMTATPSATNVITFHGSATIVPIDAKRISVDKRAVSPRTLLYRGKHRVRSYNFRLAAAALLVACSLVGTLGVASIALDGPLPPPPAAFFSEAPAEEYGPFAVDPSRAPDPS
jgi:hypothetical protein